MTNKEKFKNMTKKEKIQYIWEYYRWHIIGTIVTVLLVGSLVTTMLRPRPPAYPVDVAITGRISILDEAAESLTETFNTELNAGLHLMPANWQSPNQSTMVTDQKMMLMIQVRELDLFIMSEEKYNTYMKIEDFDAFMALDTIPELKPVLDKYKDSLLTSTSKKTGKESVFGIKVKALDKLEGMEIGEDLVISLIDPPKDMNAAISVINYLLGE